MNVCTGDGATGIDHPEIVYHDDRRQSCPLCHAIHEREAATRTHAREHQRWVDHECVCPTCDGGPT
jgi:hypothetical protein